MDIALTGAKTGAVPGADRVETEKLTRLTEEVQLLHERLHRITVGLALSEDLLATTLEQLAAYRTRESSRYRLQANRARVAADECRAFARRLDELRLVRT